MHNCVHGVQTHIHTHARLVIKATPLKNKKQIPILCPASRQETSHTFVWPWLLQQCVCVCLCILLYFNVDSNGTPEVQCLCSKYACVKACVFACAVCVCLCAMTGTKRWGAYRACLWIAGGTKPVPAGCRLMALCVWASIVSLSLVLCVCVCGFIPVGVQVYMRVCVSLLWAWVCVGRGVQERALACISTGSARFTLHTHTHTQMRMQTMQRQ